MRAVWMFVIVTLMSTLAPSQTLPAAPQFVTDPKLISGKNNLWAVPATGGWPTQLTVSDHRQSSPTWSPDGKWIAYISDYDGDEMWDVYMVSAAAGEVIN